MFSEEGVFNKEMNVLSALCARQYFSVPRCKDSQCTKQHVQRVYYPCIHYYLGNCKYGMNCKFSHVLSSKVPSNSEDSVCFFSLMNGCDLAKEGKCDKKHINNMKELQKYVKFER